jgi:hypothetical protein
MCDGGTAQEPVGTAVVRRVEDSGFDLAANTGYLLRLHLFRSCSSDSIRDRAGSESGR